MLEATTKVVSYQQLFKKKTKQLIIMQYNLYSITSVYTNVTIDPALRGCAPGHKNFPGAQKDYLGRNFFTRPIRHVPNHLFQKRFREIMISWFSKRNDYFDLKKNEKQTIILSPKFIHYTIFIQFLLK